MLHGRRAYADRIIEARGTGRDGRAQAINLRKLDVRSYMGFAANPPGLEISCVLCVL